MYKKKSISFTTYLFLLIGCLISGWMVGSVFNIPGVHLLNFDQNLKLIFMKPLYLFLWNEKRPLAMGISFLLFCGLASYINYYYRNFQNGREHGRSGGKNE